MEGVVGPQTDVYGCAATMLWLLVKRTRKGLPERSAESLMALFGSDPAVEPLARLCVWGMEEKLEDRCPTLSPLCDLAVSAQRLAKRESAGQRWQQRVGTSWLKVVRKSLAGLVLCQPLCASWVGGDRRPPRSGELCV
ncbi:unnamed protein product [Effrenium voratum]|nr:unnamed protein product [Effrenium voratum]